MTTKEIKSSINIRFIDVTKGSSANQLQLTKSRPSCFLKTSYISHFYLQTLYKDQNYHKNPIALIIHIPLILQLQFNTHSTLPKPAWKPQSLKQKFQGERKTLIFSNKNLTINNKNNAQLKKTPHFKI